MLGLGWLLAMFGCDAGGPAAFAPAHTAISPVGRREAPPPGQAERPAEPAPTDPGADALLRSIRAALGPATARSRAQLRVGMDGLRNQSRAPAGEFIGLRLRLAELLTRAGAGEGGTAPIRFVADDGPVDFDLIGTAYVLGPEGDGQWELYLTLRPAGREWAIWRAAGPVWLPRRPRPGEPQIVVR
jgi:hypothetical protein